MSRRPHAARGASSGLLARRRRKGEYPMMAEDEDDTSAEILVTDFLLSHGACSQRLVVDAAIMGHSWALASFSQSYFKELVEAKDYIRACDYVTAYKDDETEASTLRVFRLHLADLAFRDAIARGCHHTAIRAWTHVLAAGTVNSSGPAHPHTKPYALVLQGKEKLDALPRIARDGRLLMGEEASTAELRAESPLARVFLDEFLEEVLEANPNLREKANRGRRLSEAATNDASNPWPTSRLAVQLRELASTREQLAIKSTELIKLDAQLNKLAAANAAAEKAANDATRRLASLESERDEAKATAKSAWAQVEGMAAAAERAKSTTQSTDRKRPGVDTASTALKRHAISHENSSDIIIDVEDAAPGAAAGAASAHSGATFDGGEGRSVDRCGDAGEDSCEVIDDDDDSHALSNAYDEEEAAETLREEEEDAMDIEAAETVEYAETEPDEENQRSNDEQSEEGGATEAASPEIIAAATSTCVGSVDAAPNCHHREGAWQPTAAMQVAFAHEGDKAPLLILRANGELLMTNGPPRNGGGGPNSDFVPAVDEPLSAAPGLLSSPIISASMRPIGRSKSKKKRPCDGPRKPLTVSICWAGKACFRFVKFGETEGSSFLPELDNRLLHALAGESGASKQALIADYHPLDHNLLAIGCHNPEPSPPENGVLVLNLQLTGCQWLPSFETRAIPAFLPSGRWLMTASSNNLKAFAIRRAGASPEASAADESVCINRKTKQQKKEWENACNAANRGSNLVGRSDSGGVLHSEVVCHGGEIIALHATSGLGDGTDEEGALIVRQRQLEVWAVCDDSSANVMGQPFLKQLGTQEMPNVSAACAVYLSRPPSHSSCNEDAGAAPSAQMWLVGTARQELLLLRGDSLEVVASMNLAETLLSHRQGLSSSISTAGKAKRSTHLTTLALSLPNDGSDLRLACGYDDGSVTVHNVYTMGLGSHDWAALGLEAAERK